MISIDEILEPLPSVHFEVSLSNHRLTYEIDSVGKSHKRGFYLCYKW